MPFLSPPTSYAARTIVVLFASIAQGGDGAWAQVASAADHEPSIHISSIHREFATILNDKHPGNRIGYRFHEHYPIVYGSSPEFEKDPRTEVEQVNALIKEFQQSKDVFVLKHHQLEADGWLPQDWTFYLRPAPDGVDMLWIVTAHEKGLPEFYGVQQCFRLSGVTNEKWRQEIAKTPAFSEYDLWAKQGQAEKQTSLTYVYRDGQWQPLPAGKPAVGARTPLGVRFDRRKSGDPMTEFVGPYQAKMLAPIECGLIVRNNLEETKVTGLYWERTSHVTVHHPADCLHAIVNIGSIPPHARRAIRGKIYWFSGDKRELLKRFHRDFPDELQSEPR